MKSDIIGLGICETCKRCIYEADGGDGNPAIYCSIGHWDAHMPPEPGTEDYNKTWDDCKDYIARQPTVSPSHT